MISNYENLFTKNKRKKEQPNSYEQHLEKNVDIMDT